MTHPSEKNELAGPILALDLGQKLVGAAISDRLLITIKRLQPISRSNWKKLLSDVKNLILRFDAKTLVVGLPLRLDGTAGDAADIVKHLARNFSLSLDVPVYLQDERLTSFESNLHLREEGRSQIEIANLIDSESAALILRDFLSAHNLAAISIQTTDSEQLEDE